MLSPLPQRMHLLINDSVNVLDSEIHPEQRDKRET